MQSHPRVAELRREAKRTGYRLPQLTYHAQEDTASHPALLSNKVASYRSHATRSFQPRANGV
jgi:hypothetical protein